MGPLRALDRRLPTAIAARRRRLLPEYRLQGLLLRLAHHRRLCSPSPTAVNTPTTRTAHAPTPALQHHHHHQPPRSTTIATTARTCTHGSFAQRRAGAFRPDGHGQDGHRADRALSQRPQHEAPQRNHIAVAVSLRIASTARLWHPAAALVQRPAHVLVHPKHSPDA